MPKVSLFILNFLILLTFVGCVGRFPTKMQVPEHSLGPVSSPDFTKLVRDCMVRTGLDAEFSGRASWWGFSGRPGFSVVDPYFSGVAALTDDYIFLILWDDIEQHYDIVSQVSYAQLSLVPLNIYSIELYFNDQEFLFGQQTVTADKATYFTFETLSGVTDKAKTMEAFSFLKARVKTHPIYGAQTTNTSLDDDY